MTQGELLALLFNSGKADKIAPTPKWYSFILHPIVIVLFLFSVVEIIGGNWLLAIFIAFLAAVILIMGYQTRKNAVLLAVSKLSDAEIKLLLDVSDETVVHIRGLL